MQLYKNSLILRVSMTEKPFVHKSAYANMITNFIFHEDFIKIFKVMHLKGILNIGGKHRRYIILLESIKSEKKYINKKKQVAYH